MIGRSKKERVLLVVVVEIEGYDTIDSIFDIRFDSFVCVRTPLRFVCVHVCVRACVRYVRSIEYPPDNTWLETWPSSVSVDVYEVFTASAFVPHVSWKILSFFWIFVDRTILRTATTHNLQTKEDIDNGIIWPDNNRSTALWIADDIVMLSDFRASDLTGHIFVNRTLLCTVSSCDNVSWTSSLSHNSMIKS